MQEFVVIELTTNDQGKIAAYPSAHETEEAAYSKYYTVLSNAAKSNSPIHAAVLMTGEGWPLDHRCFKHGAEPQGEVNEGD